MQYRKMITLPTRHILKRFWEDLTSLSDATFEIEYILAKLIEIIEEARECCGESPAAPQWQEAFVQAVLYEGIGDYHDAHERLMFSRALKQLYGQILAVLMAHDQLFDVDEVMVYLRNLQGDLLIGTYNPMRLTPDDLRRFRTNP